MNKLCFLDLDGVLADFTTGAMRLHNIWIPHEQVTWNFFEQMGLTESDFWAGMDRNFWEHLPWTPDGEEILDTVRMRFDLEDVILCTSPCRTKGCKEGKAAWVDKHLPAYKHLILSNRKERYAVPGSILVDDSDANVDKWNAAGGVSCLLPRPWNRNRLEHPLEYLKAFVESMGAD